MCEDRLLVGTENLWTRDWVEIDGASSARVQLNREKIAIPVTLGARKVIRSGIGMGFLTFHRTGLKKVGVTGQEFPKFFSANTKRMQALQASAKPSLVWSGGFNPAKVVTAIALVFPTSNERRDARRM